MKNLILSLLAVCAVGFVTGCASDDKTSASTSSSTTMQTDTKDMKPVTH